MRLNNSLKNRRDKTGLTQVQVAKKAGITVRAYQYIEADERVPNAYTAQLIAQALGTTVEDLFPLPERQLREIEEKPDSNRARKGT